MYYLQEFEIYKYALPYITYKSWFRVAWKATSVKLTSTVLLINDQSMHIYVCVEQRNT